MNPNLKPSSTFPTSGTDGDVDSRPNSGEIPVEPPSEDLIHKIVDQVEFYFSDDNILKDAFLLKHVRRNKQGFVSLKLITSFKRIKSLTKVWMRELFQRDVPSAPWSAADVFYDDSIGHLLRVNAKVVIFFYKLNENERFDFKINLLVLCCLAHGFPLLLPVRTIEWWRSRCGRVPRSWK